ncbi:hypothetical protein RJT34_17065 [Clitoria ternatea]|uniref:Uncharacterized protein n=1 Tax=Clitoria ternatea TaxID=43366 RepID=A0AAN9J889_CLITE
MASNNGSGGKEERRRRIAERGSDRMALITGRINALPPTPPSPTHRHVQSFCAFESHIDNDNDLPSRLSRPQSLSAADYQQNVTGEDKQIAISRLKHQGGFRYSNFEHFDFARATEEEPLIQNSDTITEVKSQVSEGDVAKIISPSIPSIAKNLPHDTQVQQAKQPCRHNNTFFSSRELNACILASETTRALCSLIIASLVVFYYMISEGILASKPLYIVLLTDITIVLARLNRDKARVLEETEEEKVEASEKRHNWGDAVKLMERGLVAYQVIRGIFIDFSIYLVVVVCGISLM